MSDKLKETFDCIHAEEELKEKTKQFLAAQREKQPEQRRIYKVPFYKQLIPAAAFLFIACVGLGGYHMYFTEVARISMDINPSLELGINCFDRVVSVEGYNEDGENLAKESDVRFMEYTDAVNEIVNGECVQTLLETDNELSISVIGEGEKESEEMLRNVEKCAQQHENINCHRGSHEDVEHAHKAGMSFGKYRAYQELKRLDPDITEEEIESMTMQEIQNRIRELSGAGEENGADSCDGYQGEDGQNREEEHCEKQHKHNNKHGAGES